MSNRSHRKACEFLKANKVFKQVTGKIEHENVHLGMECKLKSKWWTSPE